MLHSAIPKLILYYIFFKGNAPPDKGHQDVYRGLPHNMLTFWSTILVRNIKIDPPLFCVAKVMKSTLWSEKAILVWYEVCRE